jgi:hypothetical protein
VRALVVVVPDVAAKDSFEVALAENEDPVETFCPHRPHPTLRVRVGPGRSDRCLDHPDALRSGARRYPRQWDLVGADPSIVIPIAAASWNLMGLPLMR